VVMRTGPHLGGGPAAQDRPDPAGQPPWAHSRPPPSVHGGFSSRSGGCPMGPALRGPPVGHSPVTRFVGQAPIG